MGNVPVVSNRLKWGGAAGAGLLLVLLIAIGAWFAGGRDGSPGSTVPGPTIESPTSIASPSSGVGEDHASPVAPSQATPVGSPMATPQTQTTPEVPGDACLSGCLVRVEPIDAVMAILDETGERPSHTTDHWVWSVVSRDTVDRLQGSGAPVYLIHDSPETLYLYVTRLPEGQGWNAAIERLGKVLDNIDGQCIVLVPTVPPVVTEIAG